MRILAVVFGGLLFCLVQTAQAVSVGELYQVSQPVQDDSEEAKQQALQQAFVSLIQRVTGDAALARHAALADYAADPLALADGYRYDDGQLHIEFASARLMAVLSEAGVPVWGSERPQLLVWWQQDGLQGLHLLGDGQERAQRLAEVARHRGMPVRFPLADLSEQASIGQALDDAQAIELSRRYGTETLLQVAVVPLTTGAVRANWSLHGLDQPLQGTVEGETAEALADRLFGRLSREMASRYAVVPGQGSDLQVQVVRPDSDSLLAAERVLKAFGGRLLRLNANEAVWSVTAQPEQLRNQMELQQFTEQGVAGLDGDEDHTLVFVRR